MYFLLRYVIVRRFHSMGTNKMITKREAKFIAELPDGYDYIFVNNGNVIVGAAPGKGIIAFKILDNDTVVPMEINFDPNGVVCLMN